MAEAETADANAKPRPQTQNTGRAGGKSCEERKQNYFEPQKVLTTQMC